MGSILEPLPTLVVCAAALSAGAVHVYHSGGLSKCSRRNTAKSDGVKMLAKKVSDLNVHRLSVVAEDASTRNVRFPFSIQEASKRGTVVDVLGEPVDLGNTTGILLGGVLGFSLTFWLSRGLRSRCKNSPAVPLTKRTTLVSSRSDILGDCTEMVSIDTELSFQKAFELTRSVIATPSSSPFSVPVQRTMSLLHAESEDAVFSGLTFSDDALNELGVLVERAAAAAELVTSSWLGTDQPSLGVDRFSSDENDTNMATLPAMTSRQSTCTEPYSKMPESMTSSDSVTTPPRPLQIGNQRKAQTDGNLDSDTQPAPVQILSSSLLRTCDNELAIGELTRLMNYTQSLSARSLCRPMSATKHPQVVQSSLGVADRITRAKERYLQACARLHGEPKSSFQSKTKSCDASGSRVETNALQPIDVVALQEVARKVEVALARSHVTQERMKSAARKAVRDTRDTAAKVRTDWSKTSSSRAPSWNSNSLLSDLDSEAGVHLRLGPGDQVTGKPDIFDHCMRSFSFRDKQEAFELVNDLEIDKGRGHVNDSSGIYHENSSPSESNCISPGASYGALALSLTGDAREGETLYAKVSGFVPQPGTAALSVRWQRGSVPCRTAEGRRPPSPTFRTILGAKSMSYTLTRADVRNVIRVAVALVNKSTEVTDNKGDERWSKYAFGAAITEIVVQPR